jgi:hypothetical protein
MNLSIDVTPNLRLIGFLVIVCFVAFSLFGVVPAIVASRTHISLAQMGSPRIAGERGWLRQLTFIMQIAVTLVLIVLGNVFVTQLLALRHVSLGIALENRVAAQVGAVPGGYQRGFTGAAYYEEMLARIRMAPDVRAAALSRTALLSGITNIDRATLIGTDHETDVERMTISDGFFEALQIPLVSGRLFDPRLDRPRTAPTAILSASAAVALAGAVSPIGRTIRLGAGPNSPAFQVVGIVGDAILSDPKQSRGRIVYVNYLQSDAAAQGYPLLVFEAKGNPHVAARRVEVAIRSAGREYLVDARQLSEVVDRALAQERLLALVSSCFAVLGLSLAAVGVYALLNLFVVQRTREIGVRAALGANRWQIRRLVLGRAFTLVAAGVLCGAPLAWASTAAVRSLKYTNDASLTSALVVAVALVIATGIGAVSVPVYRATAVDPMQALRAE